MAAEPRPWQRMPCCAGEAHDVPDDQEVVGQPGPLDDAQLVLQLLPDGGARTGIALGQRVLAQAAQMGAAHLARRGQEGGQVLQPVARLELAALGDDARIGEGVGIAGEQAAHLLGGLQVVFRVGAAQRAGLSRVVWWRMQTSTSCRRWRSRVA